MRDFFFFFFASAPPPPPPFPPPPPPPPPRGRLDGARRFDPRNAVPCLIEPVALNGRLLPEPDATDEDAE
jgi:hypothetical protein